jgi:molybdopterin molybdotransferase
VTSGGISKGAFEVVRQALAGRGVRFGTVAMQPGGPQGAGLLTLQDGRELPLLAFPGNPVSSVVSFEMFLRPALSAHTGLPPRRTVPARLGESILGSPNGKLQLRRALLTEHDDGACTVVPVGGPASHLVRSLAASNALILVPEDATAVAAGDIVEVLLTGEATRPTAWTGHAPANQPAPATLPTQANHPTLTTQHTEGTA